MEHQRSDTVSFHFCELWRPKLTKLWQKKMKEKVDKYKRNDLESTLLYILFRKATNLRYLEYPTKFPIFFRSTPPHNLLHRPLIMGLWVFLSHFMWFTRKLWADQCLESDKITYTYPLLVYMGFSFFTLWLTSIFRKLRRFKVRIHIKELLILSHFRWFTRRCE